MCYNKKKMMRSKRHVSIYCHLVLLGMLHLPSVELQNVMKIPPTTGVSTDSDYNNTLVDDIMTTSRHWFPKKIIPHDLQIVVDSLKVLNVSSECFKDSLKVIDSITRRERWALQMFDASSKFPVGILYGSYYQMGNFDECINAQETANETIQGQYCLVDVELIHKSKESHTDHDEQRMAIMKSFSSVQSRMAFNSIIHWGICVPASCVPNEVATIVKEFVNLATGYPNLSVNLDQHKCHTQQIEPVTVNEIIYGCVIAIILIFIVISTIFHYIILSKRKTSFAYNVDTLRATNSNTFQEVILCFSLIRNVGKLLKTKPLDLNLECICGVRFISMLLIISGHCMMFTIGGPVLNTDFTLKESLKPINAVFYNSPLLVDTFLLISGFLMCYLFLVELDKRKGRINVLILYVERYIRLTPAYAVVIGLYCCLLPRLGDGPLWDSRIKLEQERCLKSWWVNLLYINNYFKTDDLCMFQSWYLAVDYHLFIIAPFIIFPLWKMNKIGKTLLSVVTLVTIVCPFWISFRERLDPTLLVFPPEMVDISTNFYFVNAYIKTHFRASSYCLGLIFGYTLYRFQLSGSKIPLAVIWGGWITSAICGILSMYSISIFYSPKHEYNAIEAASYAAFHRVSWCISIGWIIIVCVTDNAVMVNKFLSWKFFIPLSRLTYCAYLVNGLIEIYSVSALRSGIFMSRYELACRTLAHVVLTFCGAFVLCILFESPIHGLEKILLRKAANRGNEISRSTTTEQLDDDTI